MRESLDEITSAIGKLSKGHASLIQGDLLGEGFKGRLSGECETAHYEKFSSGVGDRTASIRIPQQSVNNQNNYYIEDRRPCANVDPYLYIAYLIGVIDAE